MIDRFSDPICELPDFPIEFDGLSDVGRRQLGWCDGEMCKRGSRNGAFFERTSNVDQDEPRRRVVECLDAVNQTGLVRCLDVDITDLAGASARPLIECPVLVEIEYGDGVTTCGERSGQAGAERGFSNAPLG